MSFCSRRAFRLYIGWTVRNVSHSDMSVEDCKFVNKGSKICFVAWIVCRLAGNDRFPLECESISLDPNKPVVIQAFKLP